ncbi:odorant receptor 22c-like [Nylanderia fulva]|uniref:odorant receptor 22c-like n=1 Tax=Nylanderia fulva TaxID=613905 RepID=UPI0010FB470D|nr:odorant receptor 22c-like [Nylanderia fulva]
MDMSESLSYRDFLWAIKLNRVSLNLIGLWPKTDGIAKRRLGPDIRAGFVFIMIAFVSGIPMIHALKRVWGDLVLVVDNLRITLPLTVVLLKLIILRWKQRVLSSIINMIAEDWLALKPSAERDVMIKRARTARLIIIYGFVLTISAFFLLNILPYFNIPIRHITNLTDRNKPLPLQTYYFYDTDRSPQFELTFFIQAVTIIVSTIIYTSVNAFLGFVILHICGQLENFKHRIVNLNSCKDFNRALSNSVVTHLRLIRFANNTETTFTIILFVLVLQFCLLFCLYGFILLTVKINTANFSQLGYTIIAVICLVLQTFIYCFGGDLISEQCNAVYHTICNLEWYTLEPRQARNLILLTLLAKEPFRITAGKIFPLTMTTFCSVRLY